jgi:hypothetical protein
MAWSKRERGLRKVSEEKEGRVRHYLTTRLSLVTFKRQEAQKVEDGLDQGRGIELPQQGLGN